MPSLPGDASAVVGGRNRGSTYYFQWWAAGAFWVGVVICGALIRGGTRSHQQAGQPEPLDEISGLF